MTKKSPLLKNTAMLYILTLSSYVFMFVTVPYQTRVLGPEIFGILGTTTAVMMFASLLLDFGFMLYATGEISRTREDKNRIKSIFSSVIHIKSILSFVCIALLLIASMFVPFVTEHLDIFALYLLAFIAQAFLPDFLYRGMENMVPITIRSVLARSVFVVLIFSFLRTPDQYIMVPLFLLLSNILALVFASLDIRKRFDIRLSRVSYRMLLSTFMSSIQFFLSRIVTTIYGASSTLIVNAIAPGASVGYFTSADKFVTAARSGVSPVADSLYPYMIKTKNYRLLVQLVLLTSALATAGCVVIFFNAHFVCELLFGKEFTGAAPILQALIPIVAITPAQYLLGFSALSPIKLQKHANYSIFISAACYALAIGALLASSHQVTPVTVAVVMTVSHIVSMLYRLLVVILAKYKWDLI